MQPESYEYRLDAYDYFLPAELIAQQPAQERDASRLLVLATAQAGLEHFFFSDIRRLFRPGDVLVYNNSKVFPARLLGHKQSGGKVELFLLAFPEPVAQQVADQQGAGTWQQALAPALLRSSKRAKPGTELLFGEGLRAQVGTIDEQGQVQVLLHYRLGPGQDLEDVLRSHGRMPLPPYIARSNQEHTAQDAVRYQTCYACHTGSVAAPTAGLHFTPALLHELAAMGVELVELTLHVGYGTFAPVRSDDIRAHHIHQEWVHLPPEAAARINAAKKSGRRIWAVGTTSTRSLEFAADRAADKAGLVRPVSGPCGLYIYPGFRFQVVDNLITNFHLPQSSLLFLVAALAGRKAILHAYDEAVRLRYRFFSYGDAMAIITRP
ncbi:MAG: tRNA preQ1(34) S-adenosylmethionine ribosyltransferase-isomerase QueA [Desulfobulbaceae bacterium]|nr:tRNA preQ1(34) S-adenosylmethionine ribosyltransferase-isomerase QueA [Desulfobulbaceae bacterium]